MRSARLMAVAATSVLVLGACSGEGGDAEGDAPQTAEPTVDDSGGSTAGSTASPPATSATPTAAEPAGARVQVRIAGERVSPNAESLSLDVGEELTFEISSDRAGELHVHSKPEQYVDFGTGRTRADIRIETPGVVEVEDHETGDVVAVLEVR